MEKQLGVRLQCVLNDPDLLSVYQKFGAAIFRRSSVFHGLAEFLAQEKVCGDTCFEIGTWNGLTAAVLSRHFRRVVSVDIIHNAAKREVLRHLDIRNVECIDIIDNKHKKQVCDELTFDFAYLDGNHTDDTQIDWDMTKRCGNVLFHEAWPFQRPVFDLLQSLPEDQVTWSDGGLALWRAAK
jgi:hypothetical protein